MMTPYTIDHADVRAWADNYDGPSFHALLTDAPYHLYSIVERFGKANAAPAQHGRDGAYQRASAGFMGMSWDGGDVAMDPAMWAGLARHLLPGAFLFVFAGTLNDDLISVAMRQAGLRKYHRGAHLGYSYGSGFPKATNPADQYTARRLAEWLQAHPDAAAELHAAAQATRDAAPGETSIARAAYQRVKQRLSQAAGLTRVVGKRKHAPKFDAAGHGYREKDNGFNDKTRDTFDVVEYFDPIAAALAGHRYGLQAVKPALEPILVFQKPYEGVPVECIAATGAGALNIDGARIAGEVPQVTQGLSTTIYGGGKGLWQERSVSNPHNAGRWPSNLWLSHHPACTDSACDPACHVKRIGRQSGSLTSGSGKPFQRNSDKFQGVYQAFEGAPAEPGYYGDTGTAARYFHQSDWMAERLEQADSVFYCAKASRAEREAGLDPLQVQILRDLGLDLDEFASGTVGDGRETPIDNAYQRGETERVNPHPTVKPIALARHLATLLLPPDRYAPRRLLVPFAGVGSEMIGGLLAGWEHVHGVEITQEYIPVARARLTYWQARRHEFGDGRPITIAAAPKQSAEQRSLFDDAA